MLRLTFCLLLAKSAFAANAYPLDGNYSPVGPNTNLIYNFQQIRSDQPPHVELREENIHKYMNRPSTTSRVPLLRSRPYDDGEKPKYPLPYNAMQWEALQNAPKYEAPTQNWKSVPAPPTFPHWDSLSDLAATNPINYESQPVIPQQPIVMPEAPEQYSDPEVYSQAQNYMPSTSTMLPMYASTMPPIRHHVPRHLPRGNSAPRASSRYNWNDSANMEPSTTTPAPVATSRMPPPAAPTLTPWYDGY
ncbi:uncharacterized protein [Choristoneura fumiferana]|uniref:uncharacterized protein n=1 Tax=Choristoneura fumiferana TaxID=7141 RepID=UPI003D154955